MSPKAKKRLIKSLIFIGMLYLGYAAIKRQLAIEFNLKKYTAYYVQYMPHHSETRPDVILILENLREIVNDLGNSELKEKNITIDTDFRIVGGTIRLLDDNEVYIRYTDPDAYLRIHDDVYYYEIDGRLTKNEKGKHSFDLTESERAEVEALVNRFINPIIEAQIPPEENLQELFNQRYQKRFE